MGGRFRFQGSAHADERILIDTGELPDSSEELNQVFGITMYARQTQSVVIVRGDFTDPDSSQWIELSPDGEITISAGTTGKIVLSAGEDDASSITISPEGIKIQAPLVEIN